MVILEYDVPEIVCLSAEAAPFIKDLLKKHHDNKVKIIHFYSDEMHIQQDWEYFNHHEDYPCLTFRWLIFKAYFSDKKKGYNCKSEICKIDRKKGA